MNDTTIGLIFTLLWGIWFIWTIVVIRSYRPTGKWNDLAVAFYLLLSPMLAFCLIIAILER